MLWPHVAEYPVVGWKAIWKQLFHAQGKHGEIVSMMSLYTLRQRRREELMAYGAIFSIHQGPLRKRRICAWPSKIREWMAGVEQTATKSERPSEEYLLQGWEAIWQKLFHLDDGEQLAPLMSIRTLRDRHSKSLESAGCIFRFRGKIYASPSMVRTWIQLAGERGII